MALYLIRHTTPKVEKGICYGQTDLDLAKSAIEERNEIALIIKDLDFEKVFSSPLKRCLKLAMSLFPEHAIETNDNLKEMNFGAWEMQPWADIPKAEMDQWSKDYVKNFVPKGESYIQLFQRVVSFISGIKMEESKNYAVVCHDGVIRSWLSFLLEMPLNKSFELEIGYGAVIKITHVQDLHHRIKFLKI
ncbi:Putative phosphoserine phosphatase 2 [Salinivirga cyanobacteriivorans]|uniref:Alpha-ribazole phosphatase n=1 Tax=Salinivirga cyanobacteriivorans TaxID=1307839 RepID=A0A0S2I4U2_9BACT|nr:alpha-ribazole phosphatase [Salinivirga cyanobacteriivorans]ALO17344.1 Putative phosphoserine phosphatase 2 [Salinivirga cyanobacteriivorans]